MAPEGKLAALAKDYHSYSCKEKFAKYTQIGAMSLFILGSGVSAASLYYDKYSLAVGSLASSTAVAIAGVGIGRKRREYAARVEDTLTSLNLFEFKCFGRNSPSLPVETGQDIDLKKHCVSMHRF